MIMDINTFKAEFEAFLKNIADKLAAAITKDKNGILAGKKKMFTGFRSHYEGLFGSMSAEIKTASLVFEKGGWVRQKKILGEIREMNHGVKLVEAEFNVKTGEFILHIVYGGLMSIGTEGDKVVRAEYEAFCTRHKDIIKKSRYSSGFFMPKS